MSRRSDDDGTRAIRRASTAAAGISVVLSPIPLADELALVPLYAWLTLRIARVSGKTAKEIPWRPLAKTAFVGLVIRGGIDATVAAIPGVAAVINASTAVALTEIYGACVDYVCHDPSPTTTLGFREIVEALRTRNARNVMPTHEREREGPRRARHEDRSNGSAAARSA